MPAARCDGSGRRLPFEPYASMWTVWLLASSWPSLTGLVMALADLRREGPSLLETLASNWDIGPFFLVRLVVTYVAARKAFAARARWRAVTSLAAGGAALVLMLAPIVPVSSDVSASQQLEEWEGFLATQTALAAAWYGVLAAMLYAPGERRSHERQDCGVALAGVWMALPVMITHFAAAAVSLSDPEYPACLALVRMTWALFGHGQGLWAVPDSRGLGGWFHFGVRHDVVVALMLVLASAVPVAVALWSLARVVARRRWVRLVTSGRRPGWGLRDPPAPSQRLPALTGNGRGPLKVLARMRNATDPYRAYDAEPVAVVASSLGR